MDATVMDESAVSLEPLMDGDAPCGRIALVHVYSVCGGGGRLRKGRRDEGREDGELLPLLTIASRGAMPAPLSLHAATNVCAIDLSI
jgi:hypothetical protein